MILKKWMPQTIKRAFTIMGICLVAGVTTGQAAHNPNEVISPNHETYKALALLVKHGAITDTKGIELGDKSYTVRQMTPLINDVVQRREQMNDNDRQSALKMYRDYMDEIRDYNVMLDKQEKAEKLAKIRAEQDAKNAKKGNAASKTLKVADPTAVPLIQGQGMANAPQSDTNSANVDEDTEEQGIDFSDLEQPKEKALTDEQIKKKMDKFAVDDSRVKVSGDVRIRYSGQEGKSSKADARVRTEVAIKL